MGLCGPLPNAVRRVVVFVLSLNSRDLGVKFFLKMTILVLPSHSRRQAQAYHTRQTRRLTIPRSSNHVGLAWRNTCAFPATKLHDSPWYQSVFRTAQVQNSGAEFDFSHIQLEVEVCTKRPS